MTALESLAALSELAQDLRQRAPSPCISICRIDPHSALCEGCFRTIDEIMAWGALGEHDKRSLWHAITQRAGLQQPGRLP